MIDEELNKRLLKTEFEQVHQHFKTSLNKNIDTRLEALEKMIKSVERNSEQECLKIDKKLDEYE